MNIKEEKDRLRTLFKEKRRAMAPKEKAALDQAITACALRTAAFRYTTTLLGYAPKSEEVDILPLCEAALKSGKRLAFPRCYGEGEMSFHFVSSLSELSPGKYGILEPPAEAPVFSPAPATLCLVPGLSFDRFGYRLGYGRGYYDRFLSRFEGTALGVVYRMFLSDTLPHGAFDFTVSALVTEGGILPCTSKP